MSDQEQHNDPLHDIRHSAAHIMAAAIQELYPGAKFGVGPTIKDGFYYDVELDRKLTEEDLEKIENRMQELIDQKDDFKRDFLPRDEALKFFREKGQDYKCEIIQDIPADEKISTYTVGNFIDLCRGPHVENTREIKAFKLLTLAGAYWRGSEKNKMLTRIYGTAFADRKQLRAYLDKLEQAKLRDHRKLGKELDLFSFHDEAPAMPFLHAKGQFIFNTLVDYMRKRMQKDNYQEVAAPTVLSDELWKRSGHYDNFKENMYFTEADNREYAVKPMNCPGHALIFKTHQYSYRDLPMRIAEFGKVHRYERSGVTHGLMRVRAFTQDDAHHFCTTDQLQSEIEMLIRFTKDIYSKFGFNEYNIAVSTKPEKAMGSDEIWDKATDALKNALDAMGMPYEIHEGEGAFYGPKIEFVIVDSLDRPWQCGTIQVDFSMPARFGLEYIASDGTRQQPVMIHRAIYGSLERFMGILIEHFGGAFPVWMAPVQARVMAISEGQTEAVMQAAEILRSKGLRVETDIRSEKIGYKIRESEKQKIPYSIVIGEREAEAGLWAVRARGRQDLGQMTPEAFLGRIEKEIAEFA